MLPPGAEILVVDAPHPGEAAGPNMRWIKPTPEATVPRRRALGAQHAYADVIAFLEVTTLPDEGWGRAVVQLHRAHPEAVAIGGTLRLAAHLSPRVSALAILDYGRFLRAGAVSETANAVPGNNMSFKRAALKDSRILWGGSLREAELIPTLCRIPEAVRLESSMGATCVDLDAKSLQASSRFRHGRLYGGHRFSMSQRLRRLFHAALTPALPAVLAVWCFRAIRSSSPSHPLRVFGHALWMSVAWSAGEGLGYLRGPGDAEKAWR